jgi:hypothetical protein
VTSALTHCATSRKRNLCRFASQCISRRILNLVKSLCDSDYNRLFVRASVCGRVSDACIRQTLQLIAKATSKVVMTHNRDVEECVAFERNLLKVTPMCALVSAEHITQPSRWVLMKTISSVTLSESSVRPPVPEDESSADAGAEKRVEKQ